MGKYTEDDMAGLSDEEKAAINGDDEAADDATLADIAGDDEGEADGDDDAGDDDGDGDSDDDSGADDDAAGADADQGDVDDAGADTGADTFPVVDDIPAVAFVPKLSGEVLPEYQAEIDALTAKYEEGELTIAELMKQERKIVANSQNQEIAGQLWAKEQEVFLKTFPQFSPEKNRIMFGAINQEVIRLANSTEGNGKSGIEILCAAKTNVEKALGIVKTAAKQDAKTPAKTDGKPKANKPTHKTLAGVPAADAEADLGGDRFAYLDRLSGTALEAALVKLSPADYLAYQRGDK